MPPSSRVSVSLETSFGPDTTTITLQLMHAAGEHSGTLWLTATSPFSSAVCVPICQYTTTRWRGRAIVGVGAKKKRKSGRITALAARLGQSPTVAASVDQFHCDVSQATRWFVLRASQWCGSGISRCLEVADVADYVVPRSAIPRLGPPLPKYANLALRFRSSTSSQPRGSQIFLHIHWMEIMTAELPPSQPGKMPVGLLFSPSNGQFL